jgi:IS30 family transposase
MGTFEWSQLSHCPTLRLRYGEAMTIKEIADYLGVSESTVKRRIARELETYRAERPEVINAYAKLHKLEISLTWVNDLTRFGVLIRSLQLRCHTRTPRS